MNKPTFDQLYLDRLKFDPSLKKMWLSFFVYRFRVIILLILLISVWGIYSYFKLPRESNPEVKIPIAVVTTVFPGASPLDVEELITKKIENKISGLSGIDTVTSSSANSVSSVVVQFNADQDLDSSIRKVRDAVSNVSGDLPQDANDPIVNEVSFDDTPIMMIALSGPYDGFTLYEYAKNIKDDLEKIGTIREATITGGDQRRIAIDYYPEKLDYYGISANQANAAVSAANISVPAGNFDGTNYVYSIRSDGRIYDAAALGNLSVGNGIYLKDIANVYETSIEKNKISRISSGGQKPVDAVTISIIKRTGGNIVATAEKVKEVFQGYSQKIPGLKYELVYDEAKFIKEDFDRLTHDFIITLCLVMGVLFLLIGLKEAFVAGLAIPLVFFITFGVMDLTGISLNFLSTFSLLLSLGLIVDDAIVVVSATKQYMRTGKFTPEEAVLLVLNDFKIVLTTTTLTTVWAFLPLLFSSGIMGEFIRSIPVTVSVTLLASLAIALMVNHPMAAILERVRLTKNFFRVYCAALFALALVLLFQNNAAAAAGGGIILVALGLMLYWYERSGKAVLEKNSSLVRMESASDDLIKQKLASAGSTDQKPSLVKKLMHGIVNLNAALPLYEKYLSRIVDDKRSRRLLISSIVILFVIAAALPMAGIVRSEFFPPDDFGYIYINIETPTGSTLARTDAIVQRVEEKLLDYKQVANFSTTIGASISTSIDSSSGGAGVSDKASIMANLVEKNQRKEKSYEIEEILRRDLSGIPEAKVTVLSLRGGPPSGSAFQAEISGDDIAQLQKIAFDLKPVLESIPGTVNAQISLKESVPQYTFVLDQNKLAQNGLTAAGVGSVLRTAISGTEATTILRNGEDISVVAQFDPKRIPDLESVQNLSVLNSSRQPVFLKDISSISLEPSVESIVRIDQKRTVNLTSDITAETTSTAVLAEFQKKTADYTMPQGYQIKFGGANETNADSVTSIIAAMGLAGMLIIATMVIQFNSFIQAAIVLITVPLALIGVFFGLAILDIPLSFPGLIGILALFGIVVKNAIILIDKINLNLKSGIAFRDAIIDAGKSRFEAIFITSFCTIIGIVPITLSSATWEALGAAIICGLAVSSFLTLFMVPALFASFVKHE